MNLLLTFAVAGALTLPQDTNRRAAVSAAAKAPPEVLTLADLVARPERWPAQVAVGKEMRFAGGKTVSAGQEARVLDFDGRQLVLGAGDLMFRLPVADSNLLAAANVAWKELTPAQRAVDANALLQDASLWPERARSFVAFKLDGGSELPADTEYDLISIDRKEVRLFSLEPRTTLISELAKTDIIARARALALLAPDQRPSRMGNLLSTRLVNADGKSFEGDVTSAKLFVLYFSASWCGPCRQFTPSLVDYVNEVAADNPRLAVALVSNDQENDKMLEYMQHAQMPWPAVSLETLQQTPLLLGYVGTGIPQVVVVDRAGKVLANSCTNGRNLGPEHAMKTLRQLIASGAAK